MEINGIVFIQMLWPISKKLHEKKKLNTDYFSDLLDAYLFSS